MVISCATGSTSAGTGPLPVMRPSWDRSPSDGGSTGSDPFAPGGAAEASKATLTLTALTPDVLRRLRLSADTAGVLVSDVEQGCTAFRQGLARGDIITQVNRRPVRTPQEAGRALGEVPSGGTAFLLVMRQGQEQFFTVRKE